MTEGKGGYCAYAKFGPIVVVNCDYIIVSEKTTKTLGTLPSGCRPPIHVLGMAYVRGIDHTGQITVDEAGRVQVYSLVASDGYFGGVVVFATS